MSTVTITNQRPLYILRCNGEWLRTLQPGDRVRCGNAGWGTDRLPLGIVIGFDGDNVIVGLGGETVHRVFIRKQVIYEPTPSMVRKHCDEIIRSSADKKLRERLHLPHSTRRTRRGTVDLREINVRQDLPTDFFWLGDQFK